MQLIKTGVLASALLATTEALTINRAHLRAHRAASRDANIEAREPQDKIVVVHTTVVKYVKSFQKPTKKVQAVPAPAQPTPAVVVAAAPVQVQAPAPSSVKVEEAAKSPAPEPVKEAAKETTGTAPAVSGGKRGLVYAGNEANFLEELAKGGKCTWSYNWGSRKAPTAPASLEFVPMCWNKEKCPNWKSDVEAAISSGSKAVLSFNEPDVPAQANKSPGQAAAEHKELFNDLSGRVRIGSPGISSEDAPNKGISWLKQFMSACNGQCAIDFCAVHMYAYQFSNIDKDVEYLEKFLSDAHSACNNKPLWLTEFSVAKNDLGLQQAFMDKVIPLLEKSPIVERYSYFMASPHEHSGLVQGNALTSVGIKYATGY